MGLAGQGGIRDRAHPGCGKTAAKIDGEWIRHWGG
jgi:hypothetical protein